VQFRQLFENVLFRKFQGKTHQFPTQFIKEKEKHNLTLESMKDLPNELLQRISQLYCTENNTGHVLALVSKQWYINSRKAALQTVALHRAKQIVAFSEMISMLSPQACVEFQPRHLFVYYPDPNSEYDYTDSDDDDDYKDNEDEDHTDTTSISEDDSGTSTSSRDSDYEFLDPGEPDQFREEVTELGSELSVELASPTFDPDHYQYQLAVKSRPLVIEAFSHILSSASSSLIILSVYWTSDSGPPLEELLPPLPRLQELYLRLPYTGEWTSGEFISSPPRDLLPQLRSLRLEGPIMYTKSSVGEAIGQIAPRLIQLKIPLEWL